MRQKRESYEIPLPQEYISACDKIQTDENQELMVMENETSEIIGTLQLSFIQYLTYRGASRAQIKAVRVRKDHRSLGIGRLLFDYAIDRGKERGECSSVNNGQTATRCHSLLCGVGI